MSKNENRIYLSSPHMGGKEMQFVQEAFDTNWIAPLGKNVTEFENEMSKYVSKSYGVALSSGSAAIHLGLKYLGVKKDDIVFCSSYTFSGSCNAIEYLGAKPVFIDCDYETFNMSAEALEKAYKKYPNPKAVIVVNLYGIPADYDKILKITKAHGTKVLEDAAESLGSTYKGVQTGNFGDISIFSFNGNKIITTSGGGMLMTNDIKCKDKVLFWSTQSRENEPWYEHKEIGYNYRLSNVSAGIGRGQMLVLNDRVKRKIEIYERYKSNFSGIPQIQMSPNPTNSVSNCWLSAIVFSKDCKTTFMQIVDELSKHNIESRPTWKPMHMQPVFKDCDYFNTYDYSVCQDLFSRSLCLPSDTKMTNEQIDMICSIIIDKLNSKKGGK